MSTLFCKYVEIKKIIKFFDAHQIDPDVSIFVCMFYGWGIKLIFVRQRRA